jgi:hypothetical protein
MYTYATLEDLQQRYHVLDDEEKKRATALIEDITAFLITEFRRNSKNPDPATWDECYTQAVKSVVCAMVKRTLAASDTADLSSESASVGAYSQTFTYANPSGDIYMKKNERRLLGIELQKQVITTLSPLTNEDRQAQQ